MKAISKSLSLYGFLERFPNEESCLKYLFDKKWEHGFQCRKCHHQKHFKGRKDYNLRCTSCGYEESPTAHTLFHRVKFRIDKAFLIVYLMATFKSGVASLQMGTTTGLTQKTCWKFKHKVRHAMKSSKRYKMSGEVEVLIFDMGINHIEKKGKIVEKKKQVAIARESQGERHAYMYAQYVKNLSGRELKNIFHDHLDKKASIFTNGCNGYTSIKGDFPRMETVLPIKKKKLKQPKGKRNFKPYKGVMPMTYRRSMGVLYEVRGTYGHAEYMQAYLDEYFFRLNRCDMSSGKIFEHLLDRMIKHKKMTHKEIVTQIPKAGFLTRSPQNPTPT